MGRAKAKPIKTKPIKASDGQSESQAHQPVKMVLNNTTAPTFLDTPLPTTVPHKWWLRHYKEKYQVQYPPHDIASNAHRAKS